ncbi:MAG: hypothetical protein ABSD08_03590 [Xanthobacteraceae bacterium]|jgi:hypothetical protein
MRQPRQPLIATILFLAAVTTVTLIPERSRAQGQSQQVPMLPGFKPLPMAPVKPYQAVAVTPPGPYNDPSFVAFRKLLADIAQHKDRAALAKLVVAQGFFWMQDKDLADKSKSGIANLAMAIDLDAKDGSGWETLAGYADDPTGDALTDRQGVICAPADPNIDPKAFEALVQATQTEPSDWSYPTRDGVEMRSAPKPNAPVVEKLGLNLVRVLPDSAPPDDPSQPPFLHIAAPSGKAGFVPMESVSGLGGDQMCYIKDAGGWKITGYFGGAAQ